MGRISARDLINKESYEKVVALCRIFGVKMNSENITIKDKSSLEQEFFALSEKNLTDMSKLKPAHEISRDWSSRK